MVWEERFYAAPKDIISIRITCKKCHSSSTIPLRGQSTVHSACAYCKDDLLPDGSSDYRAVQQLAHYLNTLKERGEKANCDIHLELTGDLNMADGK